MYIDLLTHPYGDGEHVLSAIVDDRKIQEAMSPDFESSDERPAVAPREFVVHWKDEDGVRHCGDYEENLEEALYTYKMRCGPHCLTTA